MGIERRVRWARRAALVLSWLLCALVGATVGAGAASADVTVQVSTPRDEAVQDGQCSLREALIFASGNPESECSSSMPGGIVTVVVPAGCYRLNSSVAVAAAAGFVVTSVRVMGAGAGPPGCSSGTVVDAQGNGSVLIVANDATVSVSGMTLTGGISCPSGCEGGGIDNFGNLTLNAATITGNAALAGADQSTPGTGAAGGTGHSGGGIFNEPNATLTLVSSSVAGNAAGAGGAGSDGSGNAGGPGGPGGSGGGIYNDGGTVTVIGSTISGNAAGAGGPGGIGDPNVNPATAGGPGGAGGDGGGIASVRATGAPARLTVTDSTIAANAAGIGGSGALGNPNGVAGSPGAGGGARIADAGLLTNVTVAGNSASGTGDGVDAAGSTLTEYGSVIALNGSGPSAQNCAGPVMDDAYNVTFPAEPFSSCPGVVADPRLGSLGLHGGQVATIPLASGSAATDLEPPGGACPATDERGVPRPAGARCDAGAYELAPPLLSNVAAALTGPGSAVLTATVNPELQDTTVLIRYGTSTSYGTASGAVDAGSGMAAVPVTIPLAGLAPGTTYHLQLLATNGDGTAAGTDQTLTTPARAPVIAKLRQSATRWRPGRALVTVSRARRLPIGTTFSFDLDQTATVALTFTRSLPGRLVNHHCLAPTRRSRRRPRCTRTIPGGSLRFTAHAGTNSVRFTGRLSTRSRLTPGNYTMTIIATGAGGLRSTPGRLRFTIVKR